MILFAPPDAVKPRGSILIDRSPVPITDRDRRAFGLVQPDEDRTWKELGWKVLGRINGIAVLLREDPAKENIRLLRSLLVGAKDGDLVVSVGELPREAARLVTEMFSHVAPGLGVGPETKVLFDIRPRIILATRDKSLAVEPPTPSLERHNGDLSSSPMRSGLAPAGARNDSLIPQNTWKIEVHDLNLRDDRYTLRTKAFALLGKYDEETDRADTRLAETIFGRTELGRQLVPGQEGGLGGSEAEAILLNAAESEYRTSGLDTPERTRAWATGASVKERRYILSITVADPRAPRQFFTRYLK